MKNLFRILLLSFMVFINVCELNAIRPTKPHTRTFEYRRRNVCVWDDEHEKPAHIQFCQGNEEITPEESRVYNPKMFLEFEEGVGYFFVTTIDHEGQELFARIDNAPEFNERGYEVPSGQPTSTMHFSGRIVNIYRNHEDHVTSLRFSDRNIIPSPADCEKYQILPATLPIFDLRMRFYTLKYGHVMGVELAQTLNVITK